MHLYTVQSYNKLWLNYVDDEIRKVSVTYLGVLILYTAKDLFLKHKFCVVYAGLEPAM